jgi:hypothetical protein
MSRPFAKDLLADADLLAMLVKKRDDFFQNNQELSGLLIQESEDFKKSQNGQEK